MDDERVTVMELIRSATTTPDDDGQQVRRPEVVAAAGGALTALAGLAGVLLLVLLGALAVPRADAGVGEALGSGALVWLVGGGARAALGVATIAMTPLLGLLGLVALARLGAGRTPLTDDWRSHAAWVGGYAGVGALAALLTLLSSGAPQPLSLLLPLLVVPALGLTWSRGLPDELAARWARAPGAVRRGLLPGLHGGITAVGVGTVLLLVAVAAHLGRVAHVHDALGAGLFGGLLLVLLQVAAAPNLGIWALSLAAGPGFSSTDGASTTWASAESGVLPMLPVLAAQPQSGDLPWVTHLLVLLPVALGAWVARSALRRVSRLATTTTKAATVAVAVVVAALVVVLLDAVGGGSIGAVRLGDIGAPALTLGMVLTLEMALGALVVLARDWWVLRR